MQFGSVELHQLCLTGSASDLVDRGRLRIIVQEGPDVVLALALSFLSHPKSPTQTTNLNFRVIIGWIVISSAPNSTATLWHGLTVSTQMWVSSPW
jgi:hypothetical protein